MKNEIPAYLAACKEIKPFAQRLYSDGKDTFDIGQWWLAKETCLPAWDEALCAVSCSAPNSAPPERAFSILNDSVDDDQYNAKADYKKGIMQLQYNGSRREEDEEE